MVPTGGRFLVLLALTVLAAGGCRSASHTERGVLGGGLLGAGAGALIGSATGNAGAGAAIGAGMGALTGAAVGSELDDAEARNRAMIEQRLGRQVAAGAATVADVVAMTSAGVDENLIINHVRAHGMAAPLSAGDVISLKQQGISPAIIETMQTTPVAQAPVVVQAAAPQPVIVEEIHYGGPYWGPPPHRRYYGPPCHHGPGVSWGVAVSN